MTLFFKIFVTTPLFVALTASAASKKAPTTKPLKRSKNSLNLSVEIESDGLSMVPLRSERIRALKTLGAKDKPHFRDELEQDLYYLRMKRAGKLKSAPSLKALDPALFSRSARDMIPAIAEDAPPAKTGKTVVFFDLNFAPTEIIAAREAAQARGDSFVVVPERTEEQQQTIERVYRENISLGKKATRCLEDERRGSVDSNCEAILQRYSESTKKVEEAVKLVKPMEPMDVVFANLQRQGIHPSVFIFSGHSGGAGGHLGGKFGHTNLQQLTEASAKYPELIASASSILLWGCYTGTLQSLAQDWQKSFPTIKAFVGYRNRGPLGIRPASGQLMKSYLLAEADLITTEDPKELHHRFQNLDLVADLDATMLKGNIYVSYDQVATVEELFKVCNEFDPQLLEKFICYKEALEGCEHPPANHLGPLRDLYSYLQINRHCGDSLLVKYPKLPSADVVVRLIFLDNIKINFQQLHQQEFVTFNKLLSELELPESTPKIETFFGSKRKDDLAHFQLLTNNLSKLYFDYDSFISHSHWQSIVKLKHATQGLRPIVVGFWMDYLPTGLEHCVPFSWVEPGSKELDKCEFGTLLGEPLRLTGERMLWEEYYNGLLWQWILNENNINIMVFCWGNWNGLAALAKDYREKLDALIKLSEGTSARTPAQEKNLQRYQQWKTQLENAPDQKVAEFLLDQLKALELKALELKELAHQNPKGQNAERALDFTATASKGGQARIRTLLGPTGQP